MVGDNRIVKNPAITPALGLKYFQCFILLWVMRFVQFTYIAALAVALAAEGDQRPELYRRRSMVLAHL